MHCKRILLKLSGEILTGNGSFGIDFEACKRLANAIKQIREEDIEVAVVMGGGNIFRGINVSSAQMPRSPADQIGMLATMINGIALQQALEAINCPAMTMSALDCPRVSASYNWTAAQEALKEGKVLIFVGGTGNPYFTTDTCAALRANEIHADILLKATKVDGIYDKDPNKHKDAKMYPRISYTDYLSQKLGVMDATAVALCQANKLPIFVFNMNELYNQPIKKIISEKTHGTRVEGE